MILPILFNRFGSTFQTNHSIAGENGVEGSAAAYAAGKFGNAQENDAVNEEITFDNSGDRFTGSVGCVEIWLKPVGWSIINAAASDANSHLTFNSSVTASNLWEVWFGATGISWRSRVSGAYSGFGNVQMAHADFDVADGEWFHLACVWNTSGIDGGADTQRIYFNGVMLFNTTNALSIYSGFADLWYGGYQLAPSAGMWTGLIDNPKIYDYDKIDFTRRNYERDGMNDFILF